MHHSIRVLQMMFKNSTLYNVLVDTLKILKFPYFFNRGKEYPTSDTFGH